MCHITVCLGQNFGNTKESLLDSQRASLGMFFIYGFYLKHIVIIKNLLVRTENRNGS